MDDPTSHFLDKYNLKTIAYNVSEGARRWYIKHAGDFIKAQSGRRLTTLTTSDIGNYLKRKAETKHWQSGTVKQDLAYRVSMLPAWPTPITRALCVP